MATHENVYPNIEAHVEEESAHLFEDRDPDLEDVHLSGEEDINDNHHDMELPHAVNENRKGRHLTNDQRRAIYKMLLKKSVDGKLKKMATTEVALHFLVPRKSIQRIWRLSKLCGINVDVSHKMSKTGRKKKEFDLALLHDVPLSQRTSIRSTVSALKMSKSELHRQVKVGAVRRHSNAIKPFLKEENKIARLKFCVSMLDVASIPHDPTFDAMYNVIHIDEKWFYMTKKSEKYYLLPDEEDPLRTCKSKNFIEKVMFLTAMARPRLYGAQRNVIFDGKIGLFPFVTKERAKRSSANRSAGTLETKPITSVTKEIVRSYLINKVLPAIKEKWPREDARRPIFIQQDNARTHINPDDYEFQQAAQKDGFDIRLMCQPPNSPDLIVLDLGFFNGIQSLQYKESPKSVDDLVNAVVKSYEAYPPEKSNRIFLSLQLCMLEIMKSKGSQKYKIPHMNKEKLEREGKLPEQIKCDSTILQEVVDYLS